MVSDKFVPMRIVAMKDRERVVSELQERFGIKDVPGTMVMRGRERLYFYSGNFESWKLKKLEENVIIERVGVYFAKMVDDKIKLSIEGVSLLRNQITKNIFEMDDKSMDDWIRGRDLNIRTGLNGFLVMKNGNDFFGIGKASENKIGNFIPKSRRVRDRG
ncbi:MAG: hypothetical protein KKB79_00765 [Nanoarchaeota archaeon]|nr:hypothetical protein [Nanoarchaeota archaeon]